MARIFFLHSFLLVCTISALFAQTREDFIYLPQFAIINDPDGYVNIRDEKINIIGKMHRNEVFVLSLTEDPIGRYLPVEWGLNSRNDASRVGYMHKSRIEYLYTLPLLNRHITSNSAIFEKDNIKVVINIGTFDINDKRISKDPEYGYPLTVNGCDVWGMDCFSAEYPDRNTEIKSIECTIDGITTQFDKDDISGYLYPFLENSFVSIGDDQTLYIAMSNGDGAGSYDLLWILKQGKITQKIVYIGF